MQEKIFNENYNRLNNEQKDAVDTIYGPIMVVAWPGTGKTQIIGMRTANILLKTDTSPQNIFITTFTEAGVIAIRERLISFIGEDAYKVNISTIHSFASEVIKTFPEKFIEYKASTTIDDVEALEIIKEILDKLIKEKKVVELTNDYDKYYYLRDIKWAIWNLKWEWVDSKRLLKLTEDQEKTYKEELSEIKPTLKKYENTRLKQEKHISKLKELDILFTKYNEYLRENQKYDFNDMINFVLEKLRGDEELVYHYAEKFQFIMLDEYQDTNNAQNEIINLILKGTSTQDTPLPELSSNILVVWDDDQSIYRFQGANIENMLDFSKNYSDTKFIVLKHNYRSTSNILDVSSALIENNKERLSNKIDVVNKKLVSSWKYKLENTPVNLFSASSDIEEKTFIVRSIKEKITSPQPSPLRGKGVATLDIESSWWKGIENIKPEDIAIIVRNNREVKEYSDLLLQNWIEVESKQKTNILESIYINFLIKYLRVINNPYELENDLIDILRSEVLWLNQVDIFKINRYLYIKNYSRKNKLTFMDILLDIDNIGDLPILDDIWLLRWFRDNLFLLWTKFKESNFIDFFNYFISSLDILEYINKNWSFDDTQDIFTLFNKIKLWNTQDNEFNITKLLSKIELYKKYKYPINRQILGKSKWWVQIMTAHSSKWLEFEVVYIPWLYTWNWEWKRIINKLKLPDGIAWEWLQVTKSANEEEDRRLFFVALTRAKKELYLSYPAWIWTKPLIKSIFIEEIKEKIFPLEFSPIKEENMKNIIENELKNNIFTYNSSEFDYIEEFLKNYKLSASDLNVFLSDPKEFLQRVVFKYPFIDNEYTIFGKVYHRCLELFYLKYKKDWKLPEKDYLISTFDILLKKEVLIPDEFIKLQKKGKEGLSWYYDLHNTNIKQPLYLEYSFRRKNIVFNWVPLTGTIDKITPHPNPLPKGEGTWKRLQQALFRESISLIDYKTWKTKSIGQIKWLDRYWNKKPWEGNYARQLMFYKLLCELDTEFNSMFYIWSLALDFVEWRDWKYKLVEVDISNEEYEEFKSEVLDSWEKIKDIDFWKEVLRK